MSIYEDTISNDKFISYALLPTYLKLDELRIDRANILMARISLYSSSNLKIEFKKNVLFWKLFINKLPA